MIVVNKNNGKNITKYVVLLLEGKLTKEEFEQKTELKNK